jgi:zinc-ribbon domain
MGYPELDRDESIILEAKNVKYKSISFDARLTNRRIILIDSRKNIIPPQEILLATIWQVEAGENAIRDHLLSLTVLNNSGDKDQIVLTFPRLAGAERKRECNDWAKKLQSLIHPTIAETELPEIKEKSETPLTGTGEISGRQPVKKKIETARPLNKIIEPAPVTPIETSSLPSGIFCSRCGNRVPRESTFCNHCGTPIRPPSEDKPVPGPVVDQVQIPVPSQTAAENQDRPIEQIIHSIEPLIEDSVPRTQPTPLMKKRSPQIISEQVVSKPTDGTKPAETPSAGAPPAVIWPVLPSTSSPMEPVQIPPPEPPSTPPPVPSAPLSKKPGKLPIVLVVIVILAFIAGLIIAANLGTGQTAPGANVSTPVKTTPVPTTATPKPTTLPTIVATATPSPGPTSVPIPSTGVWVRVVYPGTFTGSIGTPGNQFSVNDSGDQLYSVSTTDGIVAVSVQKKDGSANAITAEIYKNGVMVKRGSITTPKGTLEIQFNLKSLESGNVTPAATG